MLDTWLTMKGAGDRFAGARARSARIRRVFTSQYFYRIFQSKTRLTTLRGSGTFWEVITDRDIKIILSKLRYKDWNFCLLFDAGRPYLQLSWDAPCAETGFVANQHSRKWMLSFYMTPSEVVQTAFKACLTAEEHEVRENFFYKDTPVFGPHIDVEALIEISHRKDVRS